MSNTEDKSTEIGDPVFDEFIKPTIDVFWKIGATLSAQLGVLIAVTERINDNGLLPDSPERKEYFTALKKSVADLQDLNGAIGSYVTSSIENARKRIESQENVDGGQRSDE